MKKRYTRVKQEKIDIIIANVLNRRDRDNRNPLDILIEKEERGLPKKTMNKLIKEVGGTT